MNLDRIKPETLAAGVMDYMPQSLAAHEYAERLNAALARLGLTDRLTLPPAPNTAIDELPGVVDVPLRKTLSVLMGKAQQGDASALATLEWTAQVAESIFAGLHARASVYPLALPSHESLATLEQGVDALLPRKISNGAWSLLADGTPSDGIDDGVSLLRLLCSDAGSSVTELKDDNEGWELTQRIGDASTGFPLLPKKIVLNCKSVKYAPILVKGYNGSNTSLEELHFPQLEECGALFANSVVSGSWHPATLNLHTITMPKVRSLISYADSGGYYYQSLGLFSGGCPSLLKLELPSLEEMNIAMCGGDSLSSIQEIRMPKLKRMNVPFYSTYNTTTNPLPNLILLEVGEMNTSMNLNTWNPTSVLSDSERLPIFLSNFKTYIAERLSEKGSGKTLTLSQAVRDAIEGDPTIAQIITSKGWTISPAPTA